MGAAAANLGCQAPSANGRAVTPAEEVDTQSISRSSQKRTRTHTRARDRTACIRERFHARLDTKPIRLQQNFDGAASTRPTAVKPTSITHSPDREARL